MHVLLIEDNETDAVLIREILAEAEGAIFDLEWADRLSAGLERLDKGGVDVILLDLGLPDSQGLETLSRANAQAPEVPIVVLTSLADEMLGVEAVRRGAQDYLVKGQVGSNLLGRALRYAIERQQLLVELERTRQREQEERARAVRSYQHYLAISQGGGLETAEALSYPDEETLRELIPDYWDVVINYVRAIRIREDRPSERVREFARQLALLQVRARDVVRIHLGALNRFAERAMPSEERAFSNDARLVLVELMGNLMDIYLNAAKPRDPAASLATKGRPRPDFQG